MTARKLAEELRAAIVRGEYPPGARLPSRSEMVERFGCSGWTAVNAVKELIAEGLADGRTGSGWYVRQPPTILRMTRQRLHRDERQDGRGTFMSDAHAGGWTARTEVDIRIEPATAAVAQALDLDPGTEVLVRDRVMFADDAPVQLATSWLPRDLTENTAIESRDTGPGGLYALLEKAGHRLDHFEETVRIGRATTEQAARLNINAGDPVFAITRVARTATRPAEVNQVVAIGERYELTYTFDAE